ncbi:MAG: cobalt/nickel transport protein [Petroclostridium sp.]|jgi:cobalt/nickel transport protein|nr:cobalt transporter substrate-binding protein CbiN [Clostridia bacterium]MDK2811157.1 cobalt/nickel transport protein [Petroclostridium sp.]
MIQGNRLLAKNFLLILLVVILSVIPLFLIQDAEFGGADGKAQEVIETIKPDYKPWFEPILEPASGEIESLLFALQAAIGAGFIFYYIGYTVGKKKGMSQTT